MSEKLVCTNRDCGWVGMSFDLLEAQHPFEPGEKVYGCPQCHDIDSIVPCCEELGCSLPVTCGTPTIDGYKNTCGKHQPDKAVRI